MSRWSRVAEAARGIRAERKARERERWPSERMRRHQSAALDALVRDVVKRSPFYRERFAGFIGDAAVELTALPTLDKATLMGNLDDALCDPRLRGRDLRSHLLDENPLLGEYRVMASSGSTGIPSLYVYSRADWVGMLAQYVRGGEFQGFRPRPRLPRVRQATIAAPSLASATHKLAHSADIGLLHMLRLSVTDPLPQLVEALNEFQPDNLSAYPSIAAQLADEQLAGRLHIGPRIVSTTAELRTPEMTERIERAFGMRPFDVYGMTEGFFGVECEHHDGMHLFEDWCLVENVDGEGRAVPDGEPGERLLVTNLFNRTLPLIRFEVSDVVTIDRRPCRCGRTLPRVRALQGRRDDVLSLPGAGGEAVPVHPAQFSPVAADPAVREFQVLQRGTGIVLRLALRDGAAPDAPDRVARAVADRLTALGVESPAVATEVTDSLERTPAGKLKLVVREHSDRPPTANPCRL